MSKLTAAERSLRLQQKSQEIREEFFKTYLSNFKDLTEQEQRKARKKVPWNENMTVTSDKKIVFTPGVLNQDLQRELQIYNITMENTQRGIGYLTQEGIPVQRPADYEVEMFKSPKQENRIKARLGRMEDRKKERERKQDARRQSRDAKRNPKNKQNKQPKFKKNSKPGKNDRQRTKQGGPPSKGKSGGGGTKSGKGGSKGGKGGKSGGGARKAIRK